MNSKPLVCFGNAYDCNEAIEGFNEIPCDKLQLKELLELVQFQGY